MTVFVFGEGMLELSDIDAGRARLSYGGDTLNTAIYLARSGESVEYVSALGGDPFSESLRRSWIDEGLSLNYCLKIPGRTVGLYAVRTDDRGERSFTYWRSESAARSFFEAPDAADAIEAMKACDVLYLSGITLSLFSESHRRMIAEIAGAIRARGGDVAFDTNYRARGWRDADTAKKAILEFSRHVSIALPSREEEAALFGPATGEDCAKKWRDAGARIVIVKDGPNGCYVDSDDFTGWVKTTSLGNPRDTTGAGDSFNAGFLAALRAGQSIDDACRSGHRLAGRVIRHPGAIIPRDAVD